MRWILALTFVTQMSFADDRAALAQKNGEFLKNAKAAVETEIEELEGDLKDLKAETPAFRRKTEELDVKKAQLRTIADAQAKLEKDGADTELKSLRDAERFVGDAPSVLSTKKGRGLGTSELDGNDPAVAATLRALLQPGPDLYRKIAPYYGKGAYLESMRMPELYGKGAYLERRMMLEFAEQEQLLPSVEDLLKFNREAKLRPTTTMRVLERFMTGKWSWDDVETYLKGRELDADRLETLRDLLGKMRKDRALEDFFRERERNRDTDK